MAKYLGKTKLNYIHKTICIGGLIRIAFFKLGYRWTLRIEIGQGWENCK
jgi:hypothetical protein